MSNIHPINRAKKPECVLITKEALHFLFITLIQARGTVSTVRKREGSIGQCPDEMDALGGAQAQLNLVIQVVEDWV